MREGSSTDDIINILVKELWVLAGIGLEQGIPHEETGISRAYVGTHGHPYKLKRVRGVRREVVEGNEYSRNYFDLQMYEGIDPRQCRIEVSTEDECELTPDKNDDMDFYLKLLKLLEDEEGSLEEGIPETTGACMGRESTGVHSNILGLRQEVESETIPPYVEQFEESVQDDVIMVGSLSLEQAQDQRQRFLNAHIDCRSQEKHLVRREKLSVKTQEEQTKQRVMAFVREKTKVSWSLAVHASEFVCG
ncbi:uncharacterized protein LOC122549494 [Chiloscyllium plagiosum]|uniref:uncharacterized protein LOC122549494 n=1 Tax=Chiloscyllium plagiosum TaxID=36176 RepID=UPI001CB7EEA1|nr:uncharacterized protein LOC122549494 [Chiloscyllium plagiosum]